MVQIFAQTPTPAVLNDCRLPLPRVVIAGPVPAAPSLALRPHPELQTLALDAEHVAAFVPSLSQIAVLNRPALALLRRLPLADPAEAQGPLAALASLGLLVADDAGAIAPPPTPTALAAWLHVTNACNLRCAYCYIEKSAEAMDLPTARAAVDAVVAAALRHGYGEVALRYAGGEPLLA
ncbi:MAG: radical SAM/SPASM domain-containing protein, partial [Chloroflexales bacterium]|nr:radical SAM/SPASM domain-containing protein [Chloroflexales bacterium]